MVITCIIIPLRGSILQAETCQILSLAENPRWSPSVEKIETKSFVRFTTPCTCARNLLLLCFVLAIIQNTIGHQLARQSERINKTWLNGHLSSNIIIRHGKSCKHASAACGQFLRKLWTCIENTMFLVVHNLQWPQLFI